MTKGPDDNTILRLLDGFIESKVLMTAYQLDLFTPVAEVPLTRDALLALRGLPARAGRILVDACVALGLLEQHGDGLRVPSRLAPVLVRGPDRPFRVESYLIDYYAELYRDFDDMASLVRTDGASSGFKRRDYFRDDVSEIDPRIAAEYSAYMDATMARILEVVLETYDFGRHHYLLDMCGGTGAFSAGVLAAHPDLRGAYLDVPAVVELSTGHARPPGVAGRLLAIAGDAFRTPFPDGVDVVTMCRSAHDWDDERVAALFRRIHQSLPRGGRLLVIERMVPDEHLAEARALYIRAVYFLAKSTTACYRTPAEYRALLGAAGFDQVELVRPGRDPYAFFQGLQIAVATRS
jgi:demethylspheroidene O-methyltransferase